MRREGCANRSGLPAVAVALVLGLLHSFAAIAAGPPSEFRLKDLSISLERTSCFGKCAQYALTLHGTGRVEYEGRANVKVTGHHTWTVLPSSVLKLAEHLYQIQFFALEARSDPIELEESDGRVRLTESVWIDLPSEVVTVRVGSYVKQLRLHPQSHPVLRHLGARIDEAAASRGWIQ